MSEVHENFRMYGAANPHGNKSLQARTTVELDAIRQGHGRGLYAKFLEEMVYRPVVRSSGIFLGYAPTVIISYNRVTPFMERIGMGLWCASYV